MQMLRHVIRTYGVIGVWVILLATAAWPQAQTQGGALEVVATVPELGSLAREIGGDQVRVTVIAKGTEDPHFVEAKPSFVKAVNQADVFIQMGHDMEVGWAPVLLQQGRNPKVQPGRPGFIDAAKVVSPLGVPTGTIDRSMGDVHPAGNPHYLLDPMRGLRVAAYLRDQFSILRPSHQAVFAQRYDDFRQRLGQHMVGAELASKYDFEKLALLFAHGKLLSFLQSQQEDQLLGGWLGAVAPFAGTKAVDDHDMWLYFAERFRVDIIGHMEPKPGVPPTTRHLKALIKTMQAEAVPIILTSAYYDPRHARFLAQHTSAKIAEMAHQVGSRPGTSEYLEMIDHNVKTYVTTLASG
jgi:ABC-type Zn uptake system ZnuABC Zn-binding protein ZnuA